MIWRHAQALSLKFALETVGEPDEILVTLEDDLGGLVATGIGDGIIIDSELNSLLVTIDAAKNTLPGGVASAFRLLRVRYRAEDEFPGWKELEFGYELFALQELQVQRNSFQTYNEALAIAHAMHDIARFRAASREDRVRVLRQAWEALVHLPFDLTLEDRQDRLSDVPWRQPGDLSRMTADELLALDPLFVRALRRAQVVEADELLAGDTIHARRRDGLMSSSVGETSQMYRPRKPLDLAVSVRALRELRGYVSFAVTLGRGA
jgi:hypothetical protein